MKDLEKAVTTYVAAYEFDAGDDGYHNPTDEERLLLNDCIQGLLVDEAFISAIAQYHPVKKIHERHASPLPQKTRQMKQCKHSDYVAGNKFNSRAMVRFDIDGDGLGISSFNKIRLTDRVLLTPQQMRALQKFIADNWK